MNNTTDRSKTNRWFGRTLTLTASIMTVLLLIGCGSTKVYNNDKTVVHRGTIYNVSKVKQISARNTGKLADGTTVNLLNADRKQVEAYIKENGPVYVRQSFDLDGQEMLYQAKSVKKWSEYSSMQKNFERASKQITSLLGDKKKMQLELR
jgi:hypothetical protein